MKTIQIQLTISGPVVTFKIKRWYSMHCFVYSSEQTATFSLYNVKWFVL